MSPAPAQEQQTAPMASGSMDKPEEQTAPMSNDSMGKPEEQTAPMSNGSTMDESAAPNNESGEDESSGD